MRGPLNIANLSMHGCTRFWTGPNAGTNDPTAAAAQISPISTTKGSCIVITSNRIRTWAVN